MDSAKLTAFEIQLHSVRKQSHWRSASTFPDLSTAVATVMQFQETSSDAALVRRVPPFLFNAAICGLTITLATLELARWGENT
jgi:hypothetical protein